MNALRRLAREVANNRMDKAGIRKKHKNGFFGGNWRNFANRK